MSPRQSVPKGRCSCVGAHCLIVPCPPGDYEVSIKFNEEHIPDSPFIVPVASHSDDARRLTVTSLQVLGTPHVEPWGTLELTDAPRSLLGHSEPLLHSRDAHGGPPLGLLWHPWTLWGHLSLPHVILGAISLSHMSPLDCSMATPCHPWDPLWCQSLIALVSHCTHVSPLGPLYHPFVTLGIPWSHLSPQHVTIGTLPGATSVSIALILSHLPPLCHPWDPWCSPCPTAPAPCPLLPSCPSIPWGVPVGVIHDAPMSLMSPWCPHRRRWQ